MHELAICQALLDEVHNLVATHQAEAVATIRLAIGPLSGVEPALLAAAFPLAAAGGPARHAALVIDALPVRIRCGICGHEGIAAPNRLLCAACGGYRTQVVSGDELLLVQVELVNASTATDAREGANV